MLQKQRLQLGSEGRVRLGIEVLELVRVLGHVEQLVVLGVGAALFSSRLN